MIYILIVVLFFLIIFPMRWYVIFILNKSKIKFNLKVNKQTDFLSTYEELAKKHNEIYRYHLKQFPFVITAILAFISMGLFWYNSNIESENTTIYLISFIILLFITFFGAAISYKKHSIYLIQNKYQRAIIDMATKILNCIQSYDFKQPDDYEEWNRKYEELEKYYDKYDSIIKEIFKYTGRRFYKNINYDFDFSCNINNKYVNIKRIENYFRNSGDTENEYGNNYIYSFIGYVITIPEFKKIDILNTISKKDYYYDKEKGYLYLIISEQINCNFVNGRARRYKANLNMKFEKNEFLQKNYSYFIELNEYIKRFS